MSASIRQKLSAEHDRLDHLFDAMLAAFNADARDDAAKLWGEFDELFTRHLAREDEYLIPRLAKKLPDEAKTLAAEHADLRNKLLALGIGVDLHLTKADAVAEFVSALRAHAAHEESVLYPFAEGEVKEEPALEERLHLRV